MNYKDNILIDLEYELDDKINKKELFKDSMITSKYIEHLGFKYLMNLDGYEIITSNLLLDEKIICIENNMILLKNKKSKKIYLGLKNFNNNIDSINSIYYEEILFLDNLLFENIFSSILVASNNIHNKKNLRLYKNKLFIYSIPKHNCKAFDLFLRYYSEKVMLIYISDFISYIYKDKIITEIELKENNFIDNISKTINMSKYLFSDEEKLVIINNTKNLEVKEYLSTQDFKFKVSYVNSENFKKIYDTLPG